jgi:large subunit ribosomal protein L4
VLANANKNVYLSARNLKTTGISIVSELNTYSILNANCLLLTESSVGKIEQIFNA